MPFNRVVLMGNLTRDPEIKTLPSGSTVGRLSLAINRAYTDKEGNRKEEVTFVDADAFGKTAELLGKFFSRGKPILIEGRLKQDTWEDKTTGEKRSRLGVVVESWAFCGDKPAGGESSERAPSARSDSAPRRPSVPAAPGDDDVPF